MIKFTEVKIARNGVRVKYYLDSWSNYFYLKHGRNSKIDQNMRKGLMEKLKNAVEIEVKKEKKSRAEDMKKSRSKAAFIEARLTPKAEKILIHLCETTGLNKTQVINKLLEEQEQLNLL